MLECADARARASLFFPEKTGLLQTKRKFVRRVRRGNVLKSTFHPSAVRIVRFVPLASRFPRSHQPPPPQRMKKKKQWEGGCKLINFEDHRDDDDDDDERHCVVIGSGRIVARGRPRREDT